MPYKDRAKQLAYQNAWIQRRRLEWLADKACVICGITENLEVHHRDRSQKTTHRIWSWSKERREAELAKCEVRCRRCHLDDHGCHGSAQRYASGCACAACSSWAHARSGQMGLL